MVLVKNSSKNYCMNIIKQQALIFFDVKESRKNHFVTFLKIPNFILKFIFLKNYSIFQNNLIFIKKAQINIVFIWQFTKKKCAEFFFSIWDFYLIQEIIF